LKVIHFEKYSLDNIKVVINILKEMKKRNISIQIHDDIGGNEDIKELREINKELKAKNKITISLIYSEDYLSKNYLQQIIFTTLKLCALIIFAIIVSVLGYIIHNNYQTELKVDNIMDELNTIMEPIEDPKVEDDSDETLENDKILDEDNLNMINSYHKLYKVNKDTVGWINVKGTKIDYTVVRAKDNSYYLSKNFYGEKNYTGWVFMDYRNNIDILDDNTIIYGHNLISGYMFGDLILAGEKWWYNNPQNQIITFNTLGKEMKWRIFSVYRTDYTTDYLKTNFYNDEQFMEFVNLIKGRSINDFNVNVKPGDKILTLSTCTGSNDRRLAIHAVLI